MSCPGSYCMSWANPPVCHGSNIPCGPSPPPPPSNPCGTSYCKNWLPIPVCQGTNVYCGKYSCSQGQCVQDPANGTFNSCAEANCTPTPPPSLTYCCNAQTGDCATINAGQCPVGYSPISSCSQCIAPSKPVLCCQDSTGTCSTAQNFCPNNLRPVNQCSECPKVPPIYVNCCDTAKGLCTKSPNSCPAGMTQVEDCSTCLAPLPPPQGIYSCCLKGQCIQTPFGCPQGWNQVSDCSQCTAPPPTTVNCCETATGNCKPYTTGQCPPNTKQVPVCNNTTCPIPTPPPPSGTCPNLNCSQGGFPIIFWSEHPPIGTDPMSPEIIQYYQLMNNFMCNPNPAGLCVNKLMLRLEVPVEFDGSRNCFYPSLSSPLYTEFLKNLPTEFELYAMPYFDKTTSWAAYPDNPVEQAALTALTYIPCNASCNTIPCDGVDCPAGFQCINGSCFQPNDQCGACPAGQTCLFGYGKKYPDCYTVCKGVCCEGTVDPSGAGTCCNATCDNALARAVYQVKQWNQVLGRPLFKGLVVDQEGSGYSRTTIATKMREAMRFLGVNYLIGTTYDGSNISHCIADLTATDDTRFDFAMPEVYNLSTQCNTGRNSWPPNTQLVDSYDKSPMLGGCNAIPYPSTNSLYAQAWGTANPAQSLWSGLNGLNFKTIIRYGWNKLVPQDVANRIYPLLSVETSAISPVQDCLYPAGSGGPCGEPAAFGLWNTVQGAQQFIQFVQLFQSSLSDIFMPGSGTIPAQNFGIFSFPIMPKAWFGK
jgi:hypothetical protein